MPFALVSDIGSTAAAARAKGVGISTADISLHWKILRMLDRSRRKREEEKGSDRILRAPLRSAH